MAFGKGAPPASAATSQSWRRSAKNAAARTSFPRRSRPTFIDQYRPTTLVQRPDLVRFIQGDFSTDYVKDGKLVTERVPYYKWVEHFDGVDHTSSRCSAGPFWFDKEKAEPCIGCQQRQLTSKINEKNKRVYRISRTDRFAWNVLHMTPYIQIPQIDRKTQEVRTNPNTGEPYKEWVPMQVFHTQQYPTAPVTQGRMVHYSMATTHLDVLLAYDRVVENSCRSCGSQNSLVTDAWCCGNCGDAVFEMDRLAISFEELNQLLEKPIQCMHCGNTDYLVEAFHCDRCSNPQHATLFDVNIGLVRVETGEDNKGSVLQIPFSQPPGPIPEEYRDALKYQHDLATLFAPQSLAEQEEIWGAKWVPPVNPANKTTGRTPSNRTAR